MSAGKKKKKVGRKSLLAADAGAGRPVPKKRGMVHRFKIKLKGISPTIWRRIEVPSTYTLWDLHVAIQDAMGWLDYHLHLFRVRHSESGGLDQIGIPDGEGFDDFEILPGWEKDIADYFRRPGDRADYEYDFGDGWEHDVQLEEIVPREKGAKYPRCLAGKRACPPEDCGGVGGYEEFLEAIADRRHPEHARMTEWIGGDFDPEWFDHKTVNFDNPKKRWKIAFAREI